MAYVTPSTRRRATKSDTQCPSLPSEEGHYVAWKQIMSLHCLEKQPNTMNNSNFMGRCSFYMNDRVPNILLVSPLNV